ncbi:hypothetical protein TWF970_004987 [Orbilia oligospora]|uniref:J domain-containing protein n=1 Tax=Orbilia oligospora TaxID=2813651 RepID=A0A7C8RBD6_ORBOL|nr:hypothetical protein TWF970_004987 [Orbilia oligospora]
MPQVDLDFYAILGVSTSATQDEIRKAYKVQSLKTHPDRVAVNDPTRTERTKKFQEVQEAYYTLSDSARRRDYDASRAYNPPRGSPSWRDSQFGDIFEEMMRDEGLQDADDPEARKKATGRFYGIMGGVSGAALGFIVANFPGMLGEANTFVAGAVAGNRLGAVRDAKGKSVYEVFQELPQGEKAKASFHVHTELTIICY